MKLKWQLIVLFLLAAVFSKWSFAVSPSISSLSPTTGAVGASVTITGINFGSPQGSSTVAFNGTAATPATWSANSIVVPVPVGAISGPISVTVGSQTAYSPFFTVGAVPAGWLDTDVGAVGLTGSSSYSNGVFTVIGAGLQFSGTADSFHFVYQPLSGDGTIVARVTMPTGTGANAGLMIRETLDGASAHGAAVYAGTLIQLTTRTAAGGTTLYQGSVFSSPPY